MNNKVVVKKLGFVKSLLYFLIPGVIFSFCIYVLIPVFLKLGFSVFASFGLMFFTTTAFMFPLAILFYVLEGNKLNWDSIKERFWLYKMTKWDWLWALIMIVSFYGSVMLFTPLVNAIAKNVPLLAPPFYIPELYNPLIKMSSMIPTTIGGFALKGHWEVLIIFFLLTNLNGFGLALWQRGIILPRQELSFGKWAWLINGILSAVLFGMMFPWRFAGIIVPLLILSYITQKRRNGWPNLILLAIDGINFTCVIAFGVFGIIY